MNDVIKAIEAARKVKAEIEGELRDAVQHGLDEFSRRTGIHADGISVYLVDIRSVGDNGSRYLVESVKIDAGRL